MQRTNLDKAQEAHEYLAELRGKRDRWIALAHRDGNSHEVIANRLGLSRQAVANVVRKEAGRGE